MCSPNHNPPFRGRGKNDEWGNLIKGRGQNHPRLQIGNYFFMMMADSMKSRTIPKRSAKLWLCQVYEAIGVSDSIKFKGRGIRYKYFTVGYFDWKNSERFALFKEKVFDIKKVMQNNNGGTWNGNILHFHIFGDSIGFDFINWPNEKPQGLI